LVFQAAADAPLDQKAIRIVGRAKLGEVELMNVARGGGLTWSTVNTPGISRMHDSIMLSVREPAPFVLQAESKANEVVAGDKLEITVKLTRSADWTDEVQLAGYDLPTNCTMALVNIDKGKTEAKVELVSAANVKPGKYTFTVNGSGQMARNYPLERDAKKWDKNLRGVLPSNPLTIEILPAAKK
jgi:3,4-dihydroxy-2-butanone 4-phosphate synthase